MDATMSSIRQLLMGFESLGGVWEGCEFGITQRHYGAEPLGLLRWAMMFPEPLIDALNRRFEGVGSPEQTKIEEEKKDGEYFTFDKRYGMRSHTFINSSERTKESIFDSTCRRLSRLKEKLIEDLESAEKIFVYKMSNRNIYDIEMEHLRIAVKQYGNNTLLCVKTSDQMRPFPTVEWRAPGLMVGYIDCFSKTHSGHNTVGPDGEDFRPHESWLAICRAADIVRRSNPLAAVIEPAPARRLWLHRVQEAEQIGKTMSCELLAHVAYAGDVLNPSALAGGERERSWPIQGFSLDVKALGPTNLQYRALLQDGSWTDWLSAGSFVGTRGQSKSLLGFSVRLTGRATDEIDCVCCGAFAGDSDIVEVGSGGECRSNNGAPLVGMVVLLRHRCLADA